MNDLFANAVYIGVVLSLAAYFIGVLLQMKFKTALCNPLLIAIAICIIVLAVGHIDYKVYNEGAKYISYLLTPATVCLAIPLYEQISELKKNMKAIMTGIIAGILTSMVSILAMSVLFGFTHAQYVTMLPKSITTAIGMGVSEELGGYVTITVAIIIITGIIGNMLAEIILKAARVTDPVAKGVGIGSAAHVMGTAKAIQMGEIEGAMSSLSTAVSGLITVVVASLFAMIY